MSFYCPFFTSQWTEWFGVLMHEGLHLFLNRRLWNLREDIKTIYITGCNRVHITLKLITLLHCMSLTTKVFADSDIIIDMFGYKSYLWINQDTSNKSGCKVQANWVNTRVALEQYYKTKLQPQLHSLQKNQAFSRIHRFSLHTSDFKIPTLRMQSEQHVNAHPYINWIWSETNTQLLDLPSRSRPS